MSKFDPEIIWQSYLIRIWHDATAPHRPWRISLRHIHSDQWHVFASWPHVITYLEAQQADSIEITVFAKNHHTPSSQ